VVSTFKRNRYANFITSLHVIKIKISDYKWLTIYFQFLSFLTNFIENSVNYSPRILTVELNLQINLPESSKQHESFSPFALDVKMCECTFSCVCALGVGKEKYFKYTSLIITIFQVGRLPSSTSWNHFMMVQSPLSDWIFSFMIFKLEN
jgi:hypothetical protein